MKTPEQFGKEVVDLEVGIAGARNFDELYEHLLKAQVIEGSDKTYTFLEIYEQIEHVRSLIRKKKDFPYGSELTEIFPSILKITRAHNLRIKAIELLQEEYNRQVNDSL
jgi:hypothetical protein